MRCLSCQYDLKNLADNRCPECGRAFDPKDANTFEAFPPYTDIVSRITGWLFVAFALYVVVRVCILYFTGL